MQIDIRAAVTAAFAISIVHYAVSSRQDRKTIKKQKEAIKTLADMNEYMAHVLDANNVELTEFDKIVVRNF